MRGRPRPRRLVVGGTRSTKRPEFHRRLTAALDRRMNTLPYRQAFDRIRAEYLEMPGMRLTPVQVQRLSGVDISVCTLVLDDLVRAQFLHLLSDGSYARGTAESSSRSRMAKAVWNGSATHSSRRVG